MAASTATVDSLHGARQHVPAEERLVLVDADAPDLRLLGGVERAETAVPGDRELDLRAAGDVVQRELLALRLVDEVLRVVDVVLRAPSPHFFASARRL